MLKTKLKNLLTDKGFILSLVLSFIVLIIFYGDLLFSPNTTFFWYKGDAIQVYYNSLFHVTYDDSILTQGSMNYPYPESVFFTGCMPLITAFIKLFGLKAYTVGIINLTMLLSLPLCTMFLYLIFKEYRCNVYFAAFSATSITYLTPQMLRLGGHFNLTYFFAIPATIWLMIRFIKNPGFKVSFLVSLLCFFVASTHLYLYIFSLALISFGWLYLFIKETFKRSLLLFIKHYFIQVIFPFVILQLLVFSVNNVDDRTQLPFGFFEYASNVYGIFCPTDHFYKPLFETIDFTGTVNYEGEAYIGICATLACVFLVLKMVFNLFCLKFKRVFRFTEYPLLNYFILCAILCLLFSFCIPFKFGMQDLVYKLGFLKQFRALGRFAWIFYYVINITLVVVICSINEKWNKYFLKTILMVTTTGFLSYDAYCNLMKYENTFNNKIPALSDTKNKLSENNWVKLIHKDEFQAILPLPYFHIGSENMSISSTDEILKNSCIVSFKTGLPMISAFLSRTSIGQTYKNVQLIRDPTGRIPEILNDFKNDKDILIVAMPEDCNTYEKQILSSATAISQMKDFSLYRISLSTLKSYYQNYPQTILKEYEKLTLFKHDGYESNDSLKSFLTIGFENTNNDGGYRTPGTKRGVVKDYVVAMDSLLPPGAKADSLYVLSFWAKNLNKDLFSRTSFSFIAIKQNGDWDYSYNSIFFADFCQIDGEWTLIESKFKLERPDNKIRFTMWNDGLVKREEVIIDDILFRPASCNVYSKRNNCILKNNHVYYFK